MMSFAVLAIVKATLVCGVAFFLSRVCRRTRASIRHVLFALAFAALVGIARCRHGLAHRFGHGPSDSDGRRRREHTVPRSPPCRAQAQALRRPALLRSLEIRHPHDP